MSSHKSPETPERPEFVDLFFSVVEYKSSPVESEIELMEDRMSIQEFADKMSSNAKAISHFVDFLLVYFYDEEKISPLLQQQNENFSIPKSFMQSIQYVTPNHLEAYFSTLFDWYKICSDLPKVSFLLSRHVPLLVFLYYLFRAEPSVAQKTLFGNDSTQNNQTSDSTNPNADKKPSPGTAGEGKKKTVQRIVQGTLFGLAKFFLTYEKLPKNNHFVFNESQRSTKLLPTFKQYFGKNYVELIFGPEKKSAKASSSGTNTSSSKKASSNPGPLSAAVAKASKDAKEEKVISQKYSKKALTPAPIGADEPFSKEMEEILFYYPPEQHYKLQKFSVNSENMIALVLSRLLDDVPSWDSNSQAVTCSAFHVLMASGMPYSVPAFAEFEEKRKTVISKKEKMAREMERKQADIVIQLQNEAKANDLSLQPGAPGAGGATDPANPLARKAKKPKGLLGKIKARSKAKKDKKRAKKRKEEEEKEKKRLEKEKQEKEKQEKEKPVPVVENDEDEEDEEDEDEDEDDLEVDDIVLEESELAELEQQETTIIGILDLFLEKSKPLDPQTNRNFSLAPMGIPLTTPRFNINSLVLSEMLAITFSLGNCNLSDVGFGADVMATLFSFYFRSQYEQNVNNLLTLTTYFMVLEDPENLGLLNQNATTAHAITTKKKEEKKIEEIKTIEEEVKKDDEESKKPEIEVKIEEEEKIDIEIQNSEIIEETTIEPSQPINGEKMPEIEKPAEEAAI